MQTRCERQGQVEIGVIEHQKRSFAALGASVIGRHVTGYTKLQNGNISLTTWCGQTILGCRSEIIDEYHDGSLAMMFRLKKSRFIVGYALGENGMLFRGELLTDCTEEEARSSAHKIAQHFAELDAQDEQSFNAGESEDGPILDIDHRCPNCGHEWQEQWTSACDSECPNCGTTNITALDWRERPE
jgi:ribosomal protein S27AE